MGHDTTAHIGRVRPDELQSVARPDELVEEIAHLRGNYGLYEVLDAQVYDGKVSGVGIGRWFEKQQLQDGLRRLWLGHRRLKDSWEVWRYGLDGPWRKSRGSLKPAIRFLEACLDRTPSDEDVVYIDFG
jgi:hypothetical protein